MYFPQPYGGCASGYEYAEDAFIVVSADNGASWAIVDSTFTTAVTWGEWYAYDDDMLTALGGTPGHDQVAGFIYIGEKIKAPMERTRPDPDKVITYL